MLTQVMCYASQKKKKKKKCYAVLSCTDMVFRLSPMYGHDIEAQPLSFSKPRTRAQ